MELNWDKVNGLMPAIIQDANSLQVLMLGYMNAEALELTQQLGLVTFLAAHSRNYGQKVKPLEIN